jgi:hypothetical protein
MLQSKPLTNTAAAVRIDRRWRSFIFEAHRLERVERAGVEEESRKSVSREVERV